MKKILIALCVIAVSCTEKEIPVQRELAPLSNTTKEIEVDTLAPTFAQYQEDLAKDIIESAKPQGKGKPTKPTPPPPDTIPTIPPSTDVAVIFVNFGGKWIRRDGSNDDWVAQHITQQDFYCFPSKLTQGQKDTAIVNVIESYAGYNVIVTTDSNVYNAAKGWKQEVVVTPTSWKSGGSGWSFVGSGSYSYHPVNFVYEDKLFTYGLYVGKIVVHETGHAAGLHHQRTYNPDGTLYSTYADGAHMGASWSVMGKWVYGMYGWQLYQDDKAILAQTLGIK